MKRVGIYSGTFDPVHNGHVSFALQAMDAAGLDEVVFLPEATPREKENVTDISHRFELLKRSIEPFSNLSVRMLEVEQFCAYGALPELLDIFDGDELWMLLGSDVVRTFSYRWKDLDTIFQKMAMVIAVREGTAPRMSKKSSKIYTPKQNLDMSLSIVRLLVSILLEFAADRSCGMSCPKRLNTFSSIICTDSHAKV